MRDHEIIQLTLWRLREFLREPEALFWVFAFPILMAIALGLAFRSKGPEVLPIGVVQTGSGIEAASVANALRAMPGLEPRIADSTLVHEDLRTGKLTLVITPGDPVTYTWDSTRTDSRTARLKADDALQTYAGRSNPQRIRDAYVVERGSRYIDFLIPGLLGLNIMSTGMWGVGFGLAKDRSNKLLKRLLASPMRRRDYLLSHVLARMTFLVFEVGLVLLFGVLVFDVPVRGSLFTLGLLCVLGALAFAGLGLLVASRQKTIEGVSGLMNLVMVPMWIGSGVFFAYTNFPEVVQPVLRLLPLTAVNDSLRAVMLEGAGLAEVAGPILVMGVWTVGAFLLALKLFRWE